MSPSILARRSIRLPGHNYSQNGQYFVTICIEDRRCLLGKIYHNNLYLSPLGHLVNDFILTSSAKYPGINYDVYQIMPNHIHLLISIINHGRTQGSAENHGRTQGSAENHGRTQGSAPTISLSTYIQRFKSFTTHQYIVGINENGWQTFNKRVWQRNYYEHIVRDDNDAIRIREYIQNNVINWHRDKLNSPSS